MTYHAGVQGLVKWLGHVETEPAVYCDGDGCAAACAVAPRSRPGAPFAWFLSGKPPPKWSGKRTSSTERTDFCPACTAKRVAR